MEEPSTGALLPLITEPKVGFETAIDFVADGASYFDVDAIDATGRVIGRSTQVTVC